MRSIAFAMISTTASRDLRVREVPLDYATRRHGSSNARLFTLALAYLGTFWSLLRERAGFKKGWKVEGLVAFAMFLVGLFLFIHPDRIQGGLVDARFNMYLLEHGYRWLSGLEKSFWSADFFYPAPDVITYSDNHLGTLPFYSLARFLGASRETAFQWWAVIIFGLNYLASWSILKKERLDPIGAIGGAYFFTFSLLMATDVDHFQLAPRFMVPVAFWLGERFMQKGEPKYLCLLSAACAYQIYVGIYIGYFLMLSLGVFCAVLFLLRRQWIDVRSFFYKSGPKALLRRAAQYTVFCIGFVVVLLPLEIPYWWAEHSVGRWPWELVASLLPRWQSYLYGPDSILWGKITERFGSGLAMNWGHKLFCGLLPPLVIAAFFTFCFRKKITGRLAQVGLAMMATVGLVMALTFYWPGGFTIYHWLWKLLPGAGGIRSVGRITVVLLWPLVFVFGIVCGVLFKHPSPVGGTKPRSALLSLGLLASIVLDQAGVVFSVSKRECKGRIVGLQARMIEAKASKPGASVFWVNLQGRSAGLWAEQHPVLQDLDAMFAAQALGVKVINGFSGLYPKGYPVDLARHKGALCDSLRRWAAMYPGKISSASLVVIGPNCEVP